MDSVSRSLGFAPLNNLTAPFFSSAVQAAWPSKA